MRPLVTSADFAKTLNQCQRRYRRWSWAIAWASTRFPAWEYLRTHHSRIQKIVIGIHFYQTDPDVLDAFAGDERVRFILRPDGVFHPKLYLFEDGPHGWACICGSANFTRAATTINEEAAVFLDGRDCPDSVHEAFAAQIGEAWRQGLVPTETERQYYRNQSVAKRARIAELAASYGTRTSPRESAAQPGTVDSGRALHEIPLVRMTWPEFLAGVKRERRGSALHARLRILEEGRRIFESKRSFADLDVDDRKRVAGLFGERRDSDWRWFGNMRPAGRFASLVNKQPQLISRAIDAIPVQGEITREHFVAFTTAIDRLKGKGVSVGTGTRLLMAKRPDFFVSFNSASRAGITDACGLARNIDWDQYWYSVLGRIRQSIWYQKPTPSGGLAQRVWATRVAFLDALYYHG